MRELVGGKNTIGRTAAVLKKPHKATFTFTFFALGMIRNHNSSKRAVAELFFRQHGHLDQSATSPCIINLFISQLQTPAIVFPAEGNRQPLGWVGPSCGEVNSVPTPKETNTWFLKNRVRELNCFCSPLIFHSSYRVLRSRGRE